MIASLSVPSPVLRQLDITIDYSAGVIRYSCGLQFSLQRLECLHLCHLLLHPSAVPVLEETVPETYVCGAWLLRYVRNILVCFSGWNYAGHAAGLMLYLCRICACHLGNGDQTVCLCPERKLRVSQQIIISFRR